ncbi:MAG: PilZ domain-containing protein, partial [Myxococcota bacterium]
MSDATPSYPTRRRFVRIPSVVPVDYQFLTDAGAPVHPDVRTAFTRDLSEAGLCLRVSTLPESAERALAVTHTPPRISVDLDLARHRLRVAGRVIWVTPATPGTREHLVGIAFQDLAANDAEAVRAFAVRAARRPRMSRTAMALLGLIALVASAAAYWNHAQRNAENARAGEAVTLATHQYEETALDLQELSGNIRALSTEVDALVAAFASPPPGAPVAPAVPDTVHDDVTAIATDTNQADE